MLLMHGSQRPRHRPAPHRRARPARTPSTGVDLRYVKVEGGTHTMLKDAALWHDTVADFVTDVLLGPDRTS